MRKKYRPFKEVRRFARSLGLKSYTEWTVYRKSTKRPDDIPTDPRSIYSKEFQGYPDFLATGNIANKNRKFLPYQKARQYVHKLGLKSQKYWRKFIKSGKLPENIPKDPGKSYKNKGWKGMGDWLGTGTLAPKDRMYRPFNEAKKFVHSLKLKIWIEWEEKYCKSGKLPKDIPANPRGVYKEWKGRKDWLGPLANNIRYEEFVPFSKARKYARSLQLKSQREWFEHCENNKLPFPIRIFVDVAYKNKGWISWDDFLGSGTISGLKKSQNWPPWKDAKKEYQKLAKKHGLKGMSDWREFSKTHRRELEKINLPANPWRVYTKERVWRKMR